MEYGFNPYLPSYEYVPDGEPHVFGDRIYIYGSHDKAGSEIFCENDYVCYSAPTDNLKDWRYEGVIYRKSQDPNKRKKIFNQMWAPDVCQGVDGRFYLYYCFAWANYIGVAVSNKPQGPYEYYGQVKRADLLLHALPVWFVNVIIRYGQVLQERHIFFLLWQITGMFRKPTGFCKMRHAPVGCTP